MRPGSGPYGRRRGTARHDDVQPADRGDPDGDAGHGGTGRDGDRRLAE